MAGSREGGLRARDRNLENDPDFYRKIGAKGGRNGTTGGFYARRDIARSAGQKGGFKSRRGASEATKQRLSETMKQRWAERKAYEARIKGKGISIMEQLDV